LWALGTQPSSGWRSPYALGRISMMAFRAEGATGNFPTLRLAMAQKEVLPALLRSSIKTDEIGSEGLMRLFEAFIRCRTTLDDLSNRAAALGEDLSAPVIAAHLTGKSCMPAQKHNVLVAAINARLAELSLPASARYTYSSPKT
jgi:hypothetical protein